MGFGLCNAPSTYARLVQLVLRGIPPSVALPFLDDVILHAPTVLEHLDALEEVFKAYRRAKLKLNPMKCFLFQKEVTYLGFKVSEHGLSPTNEYVEVVQSWPMPRTRKALRGFLGKVRKQDEELSKVNACCNCRSHTIDDSFVILRP